MFRLRRSIKLALALTIGSGVAARFAIMVSALSEGDPDHLLAFPLAVIFPAILAGLLLAMPATRSREGALMRLGTIIQLALIILLPPVALSFLRPKRQDIVKTQCHIMKPALRWPWHG